MLEPRGREQFLPYLFCKKRTAAQTFVIKKREFLGQHMAIEIENELLQKEIDIQTRALQWSKIN